MCDAGTFVFVADGQHGEKARGSAGWDELCFCEATTGGGGQQTVLLSLRIAWSLGLFMDRRDVFIKTEFNVYHVSKIFEDVDLFYCLATDGGGVQSSVGCV